MGCRRYALHVRLPSVDDIHWSRYQAMDRIHRLGQFRPMTVTRLFIAHSIEDRILRLQEKKRLIFEGTVGQSNAALARLTEEDLRFLFS